MDLIKGSTFRDTLRWASAVPTFKAISGVSAAAPCVITATAHGVPEGWEVAISNVVGMARLNAQNTPPQPSDFHKASVLSADSIVLPYVNALGMGTYASGGVLMYYTPIDLTGYTARMSIKDQYGGTVLLSLTTENGGIIIDTAAKTISRYISASDTALIDWSQGVCDLEMIAPGGDVKKLIRNEQVYILDEVTT